MSKRSNRNSRFQILRLLSKLNITFFSGDCMTRQVLKQAVSICKVIKSWLIGKDSDAGRDWWQEEKGTTEDEMAGWHHRLDGCEFEWTPGDGDGQGALACCNSWGRKESDTNERLNWKELNLLLKTSSWELKYEAEKAILSSKDHFHISHTLRYYGKKEKFNLKMQSVRETSALKLEAASHDNVRKLGQWSGVCQRIQIELGLPS